MRGGRRVGEEKRRVVLLAFGLKIRGPNIEGFEMRRGGLKTDEIGKRDFHSSGMLSISPSIPTKVSNKPQIIDLNITMGFLNSNSSTNKSIH